MSSFEIDPLYLVIGVPSALAGLLIGILLTWLVGRSRRKRMLEEREAAFELANARLTETFAELSYRSCRLTAILS